MIKFRLTDHAQSRLRQRGMRSPDAAFVIEFGTQISDGYVLSRKDADEIRNYAKALLDQADRLCGKRIVCDGNDVVTGYHATDRQQHHLL